MIRPLDANEFSYSNNAKITSSKSYLNNDKITFPKSYFDKFPLTNNEKSYLIKITSNKCHKAKKSSQMG